MTTFSTIATLTVPSSTVEMMISAVQCYIDVAQSLCECYRAKLNVAVVEDNVRSIRDVADRILKYKNEQLILGAYTTKLEQVDHNGDVCIMPIALHLPEDDELHGQLTPSILVSVLEVYMDTMHDNTITRVETAQTPDQVAQAHARLPQQLNNLTTASHLQGVIQTMITYNIKA